MINFVIIYINKHACLFTSFVVHLCGCLLQYCYWTARPRNIGRACLHEHFKISSLGSMINFVIIYINKHACLFTSFVVHLCGCLLQYCYWTARPRNIGRACLHEHFKISSLGSMVNFVIIYINKHACLFTSFVVHLCGCLLQYCYWTARPRNIGRACLHEHFKISSLGSMVNFVIIYINKHACLFTSFVVHLCGCLLQYCYWTARPRNIGRACLHEHFKISSLGSMVNFVIIYVNKHANILTSHWISDL